MSPTALLLLCIAIAGVLLIVAGVLVQRTAPPDESRPEPRIVEAVAAMASVRQRPDTAKQIEAAMSAAVHECMSAGVSLDDADTIRAAMLAARARVLREGN